MNPKGLLPQDVDFLNNWMDRLQELWGLDLAEAYLVRHSILRIAANNIRREYLRKPGESWNDPMPRGEQLSHVVDWLRSDLYDGAEWLGNQDENGRQKKIMKCSSYDDLMREADKVMDRRNAQVAKALGPDDEAFEAHLGGGYTLVRMLTPEALDLESARMSHCVGHGSYDRKLRSGWGRFLSVRDRKRRPMATIELRQEPNANWSICQIQGKRNETPTREVMDTLRAYAVAQNWWGRDHWWPTITMSDGTECFVDQIPEGAIIRGFDEGLMGMLDGLRLPANLTVLEGLFLSPLVALPENLTVNGTIEFTRRVEGDAPIVLPESLVAKEIRVCAAEDVARPIPMHLLPRIRVRIRKLTGHSFASLRPIDEEQSLNDEDGHPSQGM